MRLRLENSGRTIFARHLVMAMEQGIVTAKTSSSSGARVTIMKKEPTTVTREEMICVRSVERVAPTVSTS